MHIYIYILFIDLVFSYAAISGIAGAQSVLFAKLLVSLIKASLGILIYFLDGIFFLNKLYF